MKSTTTSYYVPAQSGWPILCAAMLFILALGSLNLQTTWGLIACVLGLAGLFYVIAGWFHAVVKESNAGLYNLQMDKTFRWGMLWFLISEIFLFGLLLGSLFHVRFSITPWLAGHRGDASILTHYLLWPDFFRHWPLLTTPEHAAAAIPVHTPSLHDALPVLSLFSLMISDLLIIQTLFSFKKAKYTKSLVLLYATILSGLVFFGLQSFYLLYLIENKIFVSTGVYGSLLIAFLIFHCANALAALALCVTVGFRIYHKHITVNNSFGLDAAVWWWSLLTIVWILGVFLIL